jgi:hypothetical protein
MVSVEYNILDESTHVKGEIGEVIAANYLRKIGFIVKRPWRIISLLERVGVPNNYEVQFLRRYKKTMDFFAVYPCSDSLLIPREAVCDVFAKGGLNRYNSKLKSVGYVVEVKTNLNGSPHHASKKQAGMFRLARKLGFGVLLVHVTLNEDFTAGITLKTGSRKGR